ncbi:uncharacterized protein LOC117898992 [Drosophila subobscura]|uniref:uncharacterized protein LOC117898992 n=1 Tax=Drosophila subobscura TaxID=7241 RepID=UPI00155A0E4E|nr:uncharacterized protein LOC117898992 [Drosophila subobscura]
MAEKHVNPNEYLDIPKWVSEDYFLPILEQDVSGFQKIISFTPIAATAPGDNYTSIMIRVHIDILLTDGKEQKISYILKTQLDASKGGALISQMGFFAKEKEMYKDHIPQFVRLYKEAGVYIELAPKCVHLAETPESITLVFEDLSRQNFRNVDRLKGFDMAHMRCVLRKLAELHAASVVNRLLIGPYDSKFYESFFNEKNREVFSNIREQREPQLKKAMLEWGLPDVDIYLKKHPTSSEYFDAGLALSKVDESEFNVLNHGDCWSNNIMFNYKENGEIDRTIFVDLQVAKWGSPAQDLWYMITTSASLDIKVKEFDHFIRIYHDRLTECLKLLKYSNPIPSLRDIQMQMLKHGFWGPFTANGVMVVVLFPSDKDSNMDKLMGAGPEADALREKSFKNPYYADAMRQLLPFFDNKGLLDM